MTNNPCAKNDEQLLRISVCADAAWLLSKEAFALYAPCLYQPTYAGYRERMRGYLAAPGVVVGVGRVGGEPVAMLTLAREALEAVGVIIGIAVAPAWRRQGIGRRLLAWALEIERLSILRAETDAEAVGFYRRPGFAVTRAVKQYPDGAAVRYECVLARQSFARAGREMAVERPPRKWYHERAGMGPARTRLS